MLLLKRAASTFSFISILSLMSVMARPWCADCFLSRGLFFPKHALKSPDHPLLSFLFWRGALFTARLSFLFTDKRFQRGPSACAWRMMHIWCNSFVKGFPFTQNTVAQPRHGRFAVGPQCFWGFWYHKGHCSLKKLTQYVSYSVKIKVY